MEEPSSNLALSSHDWPAAFFELVSAMLHSASNHGDKLDEARRDGLTRSALSVFCTESAPTSIGGVPALVRGVALAAIGGLPRHRSEPA